MNGKPASAGSRLPALVLLGLMIALPLAWVIWSLNAASVVAAGNRSQATLLAGLEQRLSALAEKPAGAGPAVDAKLIYLPGGTPAIAGAALQQLVGDAVEAAGGKIVESEVSRVEPTEEDPGRVDLRVSFDAEIVSLQNILFGLETGAPLLFLRSLDVQSDAAQEVSADQSPPLRIVMLVGGYWEAAP
jgi:hypothetical protein